MAERRVEEQLEREQIANKRKHWVRAVTACNSRCLFCLDADTPRNVYLEEEEVRAELLRGREELDAEKVIISGGEASLHPQFFDFIRYAKDIGYDRVQTVTNGYRFADRQFYLDSMRAGLGEITFSLHGHNAELHNRLTQTPEGFERLIKGMVRAIRDPYGPIVNIDVVINKQNVGVIDKIIELAASLGVTEFDLLHVIPQANAFTYRDQLFYDPTEHLERLQKVFRLNRHPRFVVWTNRFPVAFLEGMEDLIQDPHKMLDEVNGRRFHVRNYLDHGKPLECRDAERCVHCFIEPFCTTMDRQMAIQREEQGEVWSVGPVEPGAVIRPPGDADALPYGCQWVGVAVNSPADLATLDLPAGARLEARIATPGPLPEGLPPHRLLVSSIPELEAWLDSDHPLIVELNQETAPYLLEHRSILASALDRVSLHQAHHEHMSAAVAQDLRDPAEFFTALNLPIAISGLAACQTPGARLVEAPRRLRPALFDPETGRIAIRELARDHVQEHYLAKSVRCKDCRVTERCDGIHINMIRDQGLKLARPLTEGAWAEEAERQLVDRWPTPPRRLNDGRPPEAPPRSLPGFAEPTELVIDPLAAVAAKLQARREARKAARAAAAAAAAQKTPEAK